MRPFVWKKSEKAEEKDRKKLGTFFKEIEALNQCDRAAH